jgi:heme/copper-type cytochrome/quinol oxidase subunit 2
MQNTKTFYWCLMGAATLAVAFAPLPFITAPIEANSHTFRVEASQYAYSPAELHVNPGDIVIIELISTDVVHGLYVDGYGVSVEADPGMTTSLTFVADRPGSFRFRCNVTCGALHPFMIGRMTVGDNTALFRGMGLTLIGALGVMLSPRKNTNGGVTV